MKKFKDYIKEWPSLRQRKLASKITKNAQKKKDKNDVIKKNADLIKAKEKLK